MNDKTFLFSTRSLVHLQAEQIRVHSHEVSKIWQRVDEERETRIKLEAVGCLWKHILSCSWHQTTNSRILFSSFHEFFSQSFHWSKTEKTMFWTNKKVISFSMAQMLAQIEKNWGKQNWLFGGLMSRTGQKSMKRNLFYFFSILVIYFFSFLPK